MEDISIDFVEAMTIIQYFLDRFGHYIKHCQHNLQLSVSVKKFLVFMVAQNPTYLIAKALSIETFCKDLANCREFNMSYHPDNDVHVHGFKNGLEGYLRWVSSYQPIKQS